MRPLKILTWHTHGTYLYYLTQVPHEFYVLSKYDRQPGYGGRFGHFPWGSNVYDLPVEEAKNQQLDCILFQDDAQYFRDQYQFLSETQRRLPRIYLEHDPPRGSPTDTRHPIDDPDVLLIHVTPFNALMWDSGRTPTQVIEHGVISPKNVKYSGELERGIVVVNHLARRGRRLGADIFTRVRKEVPLNLVGMGAEALDGLGEVQHAQLPSFAARYRFFFNPIRYTSLGLAVIEAMMVGLPIVGLATTEMSTVIDNDVSGYVDTDVDNLILRMKELLAQPAKARQLGEAAKRYANERFNIQRFVSEWSKTFRFVTGHTALTAVR
ncbi:MAG: glycosyltransferase family 4 protein [Pseudomonadota bacterium]